MGHEALFVNFNPYGNVLCHQAFAIGSTSFNADKIARVDPCEYGVIVYAHEWKEYRESRESVVANCVNADFWP